VRSKAWSAQVELVIGSADDPAALHRALTGVAVAYYLVHSMDGNGDFVARDRELAKSFAAAARATGVSRIVYLSGLHPTGELSSHLGSRVEVGRILLDSGVPTAVLQAGVVLGAGSASFDMLRHLTERLPAMLAPKWLRNRIQPIAIADVLHYLAAAAELPAEVNRTFDIGGPDVLTYAEMIAGYARVAGIRGPLVLTVPVLTPRLASHWVGFVTPVRAGIARPLVGSLVHEAVAAEDDLARLVSEPPHGRTPFEAAIRLAVADVDPHRWGRTALRVGAMTAGCALIGSVLTDSRSQWYQRLSKPSWQPPAAAFPIVWTSLFAAIFVAATATIADAEETGSTETARRFEAAYLANLALNAAWSAVFFRLRSPRAATVVAAALAASAGGLAAQSAPLGKGKAAAFAGYAAWCTFATALSAAIAGRN